MQKSILLCEMNPGRMYYIFLCIYTKNDNRSGIYGYKFTLAHHKINSYDKGEIRAVRDRLYSAEVCGFA